MTLLAMWLDDKSVALAADCKMTECEEPQKKLHLLSSGRVMLGIGFTGDGAHEWLLQCHHCENNHDYPGHWCYCSQAESVDELEQLIRDDLEARKFPSDCTLTLCVAGFNRQDSLEAFVLDGTGCRVMELTQGEVWFSPTDEGRNKMESIFWKRKRQLEDLFEFAGVQALYQICSRLISRCDRTRHGSIGLGLDFCYGDLGSPTLSCIGQHYSKTKSAADDVAPET